MTKRAPYLIAVPLIVAMLTGCTSASPTSSDELSVDESELSQYRSVVALLDPQSGTITLPLDAFFMSDDERRLIETANDQLMDNCLQRYGFQNPLLGLDRRLGVVGFADRRYGVWSDEVLRYGYDIPPSPVGDQITAALIAQSKEWGDAEAKCYTESDPLPILTSGAVDAPDTVIALGARGVTEAYVYAASTPEWKQARQDWWACLSREGLTPRTGPTEWTPDIPTDAEAALRVANIDMACKTEVNLVQRLADLEARYQAAFAADNQAALVAQRGKVEEVLEQAGEIVGTR